MNWRNFFGVIACGITGLAAFVFIVFVSGFAAGVVTLITLWGAGISFTVALVGTATIHGLGVAK